MRAMISRKILIKLGIAILRAIFSERGELGAADRIARSFQGCPVYLSDTIYEYPTKEQVEKLLRLNIYDALEYRKEEWDCDDYALQLYALAKLINPGWAFGLVWVRHEEWEATHALNFFIDREGSMWYVEPQTSRVFINPQYKPFLVV